MSLVLVRSVIFREGVLKAVSVHAENIARSAPPSLLPPIDVVVDVGAFCDFFVCYSLLPTYCQESSEAPSLKTSVSALVSVSEAYSSTARTLDLYVFSLD